MSQTNQTIEPEWVLSRSLATMEKIIDISQALVEAHDLETIMKIVRTGTRELTGSDGATFVLREGDFCHYADEDAIQPLWKGQRFPIKQCVSGWAMLNHQVAIVSDIYEDERVPHDIYEPTFVRGMILVPIRSDNPLGAIGCYWSTTHTATPIQTRLLQILATMTAAAMENVRFTEELKRRAEKLERSFESTLLSISKIVDLRDAYTAGHENEVGIIACKIGRKMGYSDEHCQLLKWAGIVHDVGKIAIPAEILSKPGRLSSIEYKLVQTHAQMSYEILQGVEMNYPLANVVLQHHERLDGSGYPLGLKGDEILKDAQIIAVADVFEAMVSHRPYRAGLGYDKALQELIENKETKYDAEVVDTLVNLVRNEGLKISHA
jgi:HD-GYP domain-containing protein (c-di-GMP phosphodiesterase class II)